MAVMLDQSLGPGGSGQDNRGRQREVHSRFRVSVRAHCPYTAFAPGRGQRAADLMRPCTCFHEPALNTHHVRGCWAQGAWGTGSVDGAALRAPCRYQRLRALRP